MNKLCKVKVKMFETTGGGRVDSKINNFIRAKNKDGDNFKIIDIQYRPITRNDWSHWDLAMVIYEDYDMDDYNPEEGDIND